jgi:uncharacterized protein YnzC (UPF0291/DUF896 family)
VVAAERTKPLSKEELQTARSIIRRMLLETDRTTIREMIEKLRRIVDENPSERRPN